MTDTEVLGPIDFVLLEFPDQEPSGAVAAEILALVEAGTIRLWDAVAIRKAEDGSVAGVALEDVTPDGVGGFAAFSGARSGLLGDEDLATAAEAVTPGTIAVLLVYENTWAAPFVSAARAAGGQMVASTRIPAQDIMDTLDALEAAG